jgi:hypothetical protein
MTGHCKGSDPGGQAIVRRRWLSSLRVVVPGHSEAPLSPAPWQRRNPSVMIKRILLALTFAASLGGAVVACNTPAATNAPTAAPTTAPASVPAASAPAASDAAPSVEPSAS